MPDLQAFLAIAKDGDIGLSRWISLSTNENVTWNKATRNRG
jgi:hypothetical protein